MELDELKLFIHEKMERVQHAKSPADIALLLGKKTNSVVGKIKRSLITELITSVVFTIACAAIALFSTYEWLQIYFGIFTAVCALFLPVLYLLLQKTKKLSSTAMPVKSNLLTLTALIKEYTKRYFQFTLALIPISLLIALFLGYNDQAYSKSELNNKSFIEFLDTPFKISFILLYIVSFSVGMYYFTKWYLKKLYGNYIIQLEALIVELEETR